MEAGHMRHRLVQCGVGVEHRVTGPWEELRSSIIDPCEEWRLAWYIQHRRGAHTTGRTLEVGIKGARSKASHCVTLGHLAFQKVIIFILHYLLFSRFLKLLKLFSTPIFPNLINRINELL